MRYWIILIGGLLLVGCQKNDDVVPQGEKLSFVVPSHFPEPVYDFSINQVSQEGVELGRKLFYDKRLSSDGTVSCGSCHAQVHGFADHGTSLSEGVEGKLGMRNAPGIFNLAWYPNFMWDGGINHLEVMPLAPFTDSSEMNMKLPDIIDFLRNDSEYEAMFSKVFGEGEIDTQKMLYALAQFQGMIVSDGSKYDKYLLGELSLEADEMSGLNLFESNCASCHAGVLQTDFSYRNNGLGLEYSDSGRHRITLDESDRGKFRVPSLRNAGLTNPYMHDGRFFTLEQVLEHYASGIQPHPNLDPSLQGGINLTESEQADIISFIHTLSDYELISNLEFSEPNE